MHEMAIAAALVRQLEAVAAEHGLTRIDAVTVRAGIFRQIVPDALEAAFEAVAQGTCAAGAMLTLEIVPPLARCRPCGHQFAPDFESFLCPRCGQADVELLEGDDIVLASVTAEDPQGASADED